MHNRNVRFAEIATKPLTNSLVPKNRKPRFEVVLRIVDLNNVPLVSGAAFVKWHLPNSAAAEHRGRTSKATIKDHKVVWDYDAAFGVRLVIDKTGLLHDSDIHFEVVQEYSSGARADRITLGLLRLNLAEYVEEGEDELGDGSGGITRRYLMQESKINSTVKIGFSMKQIDGDRNFQCPPLRSAAVFGGIAGIMTNSETVDPNGSDELLPSSMSNPKAKDFSEMQDMYRRSLAASWSSYMHELPADQCVEDIFAGGDGWGRHLDSKLPKSVPLAASNKVLSGAHTRYGATRHQHSGFAKYLTHKRESSKDFNKYGRSDSASTRSSAAADSHSQHSSGSEEARNPNTRLREISEFELIEDMSSWRVSPSPERGYSHEPATARMVGKVV